MWSVLGTSPIWSVACAGDLDADEEVRSVFSIDLEHLQPLRVEEG
jgi:hypothetical protein